MTASATILGYVFSHGKTKAEAKKTDAETKAQTIEHVDAVVWNRAMEQIEDMRKHEVIMEERLTAVEGQLDRHIRWNKLLQKQLLDNNIPPVAMPD